MFNLHITKHGHKLLNTHYKCSLTKFAKLLSIFIPSCLRFISRRCRPPNPIAQSGWSISLDSVLENVSAFVLVVNTDHHP